MRCTVVATPLPAPFDLNVDLPTPLAETHGSKDNTDNDKPAMVNAAAASEALDLLAQLSYMDPDDYHKVWSASQDENDDETHGGNKTDNGKDRDDTGNTRSRIPKRLMGLQQKWLLPHLDIRPLVQALHRWQSLTATEAAQHDDETKYLHEQLQAAHRHRQGLETALNKVVKKNQRLQQRLQQERHDAHMVRQKLEKRLEDYEQQESLRLHESLLQRRRADTDDTSSTLSSLVTDDGVATVKLSCETAKEILAVLLPGHDAGISVVAVEIEERPRGLLDVVLNEETDNGAATQQHDRLFGVHRGFGLRRRQQGPDTGYLVCGTHGHAANMPPIGSRLLSVNGQPPGSDGIIHVLDCETMRLLWTTYNMTAAQSDMVSAAAALLSERETSTRERDLMDDTRLEVVHVPKETNKLQGLMSFQQQPQHYSQSLDEHKSTGGDNSDNCVIGSDRCATSNTGASDTPKKMATEKLGNAMKAMGRPFKSLF